MVRYNALGAVVDLEDCIVHPKSDSSIESEDWGIFKAKANGKNVCYLYDKNTLCIVFYFIIGEHLCNAVKAPMLSKNVSITIDEIAYNTKTNIYNFKFYVYDVYDVCVHAIYDANLSELTVEYSPTRKLHQSASKTYRNIVPKLDTQGKLKLTLSNTCTFEEIEAKEVD